MNDKQINDIAETMRIHFAEMGWSEKDISIGMGWVTKVMLLLIVNQIPLTHEKFPEVLRSIANAMQVINESTKKNGST